MNVNKVLLVGRVTGEPQLRTTPTGQSVTSFSIATNRTWKDKSGAKQDEAEFHTVVVWGRQAEVASQFIVKGMLMFIEGRLKTRSWTDKQGVSHKTTEVICENFQFGPRPAGSGAGTPSGGGAFTAQPKSSSQESKEEAPPAEDLLVIDIEDDIKAEDLPF